MKHIGFLLFPLVVFTIVGCSSPQDRAYEAQEGVHNERLKLVEQYQKCVKDSADDTVKAEACEQYLKASEALK